VFGQIACCLQDVPFEFHRFRLPRRCRQGKSESAPFPSPSHNISSAASDPCGAIWGSALAACHARHVRRCLPHWAAAAVASTSRGVDSTVRGAWGLSAVAMVLPHGKCAKCDIAI
jgi:hypothetical protein